MKKLISIILLLNILRFKYIEYRIPVKEENKIITFKKDSSDSLIEKWSREVFNKN